MAAPGPRVIDFDNVEDSGSESDQDDNNSPTLKRPDTNGHIYGPQKHAIIKGYTSMYSGKDAVPRRLFDMGKAAHDASIQQSAVTLQLLTDIAPELQYYVFDKLDMYHIRTLQELDQTIRANVQAYLISKMAKQYVSFIEEFARIDGSVPRRLNVIAILAREYQVSSAIIMRWLSETINPVINNTSRESDDRIALVQETLDTHPETANLRGFHASVIAWVRANPTMHWGQILYDLYVGSVVPATAEMLVTIQQKGLWEDMPLNAKTSVGVNSVKLTRPEKVGKEWKPHAQKVAYHLLRMLIKTSIVALPVLLPFISAAIEKTGDFPPYMVEFYWRNVAVSLKEEYRAKIQAFDAWNSNDEEEDTFDVNQEDDDWKFKSDKLVFYTISWMFFPTITSFNFDLTTLLHPNDLYKKFFERPANAAFCRRRLANLPIDLGTTDVDTVTNLWNLYNRYAINWFPLLLENPLRYIEFALSLESEDGHLPAPAAGDNTTVLPVTDGRLVAQIIHSPGQVYFILNTTSSPWHLKIRDAQPGSFIDLAIIQPYRLEMLGKASRGELATYYPPAIKERFKNELTSVYQSVSKANMFKNMLRK